MNQKNKKTTVNRTRLPAISVFQPIDEPLSHVCGIRRKQTRLVFLFPDFYCFNSFQMKWNLTVLYGESMVSRFCFKFIYTKVYKQRADFTQYLGTYAELPWWEFGGGGARPPLLYCKKLFVGGPGGL